MQYVQAKDAAMVVVHGGDEDGVNVFAIENGSEFAADVIEQAKRLRLIRESSDQRLRNGIRLHLRRKRSELRELVHRSKSRTWYWQRWPRHRMPDSDLIRESRIGHMGVASSGCRCSVFNL